jgi:uncharacterized membrane protein
MVRTGFSIIAKPTTLAKVLFAPRTGEGRYWELDFIRGLAIVVMVLFHFSWDLQYFDLLQADFLSQFAGMASNLASIFVMLVGVSLTLSYRREIQRSGEQQSFNIFKKYLMRGALIFALGLGITVVALIIAEGRVDFGILHLIGFSVAAAFPFLRFRWFNLALGIVILLVGYLLVTQITPESRWFVWLGFRPEFYTPQDYFPVLPWFGWTLIGLALGNFLYTPPDERKFKIPDLSKRAGVRHFSIIGRNSLLIYIVHQPILFPLVFVVSLLV